MKPPRSTILDTLQQQAAVGDSYLAKRTAPRSDLRVKTSLDLRRADDRLLYVTAFNVSDTGLGFMCREPLAVGEQIELRLASDPSSRFEPFCVRRLTPTVGGFIIGAAAC